MSLQCSAADREETSTVHGSLWNSGSGGVRHNTWIFDYPMVRVPQEYLKGGVVSGH